MLQPSGMTIYCLCLDGKPARRRQTQARQVDMICAAHRLDGAKRQEYAQAGYVFDDEGENLSALNAIFGDLTGTYWVWKNAREDFVGVSHYRRPWIDEDLAQAREDTLYVPRPVTLGDLTVRQQLERCHLKFPAPDISYDLARRGRIPLTEAMLTRMWESRVLYVCNMMRGNKRQFDRFAQVFLETMMPFYEENQELCHSLRGYDSRSIAFTAERIMTALLLEREHFFGDMKIDTARVDFIPDPPPTPAPPA